MAMVNLKQLLSRGAVLWAAFIVSACSTDPDGRAPPTGPIGEAVSAIGQQQRVIVQLTANANPDAVAASVGIRPAHVYRYAIKGFSAELPAEAIEALWRNPLVENIEADGIATVNAVSSWGIDRIDQRFLPLDDTFAPPNGGAGVHAYIIDSGIRYSHLDFGGRAVFGADFVGGDGSDCLGHGSHVAGTVGGTTFGVAKQITLVSVRVFGCVGSSPWETILAGIDWTVGHGIKPAVLNLSLGGGYEQIVNDAVAGAVAAGFVVAVAGGNAGSDACDWSPSSALEALSVGATDRTDARVYFSNWGPCLDVFAPGVDISSAGYENDFIVVTLSGTSMSSPHVAGVAALWLSSNPTWTPAQVATALVGDATPGVVSNLQPFGAPPSPNLLLFSGTGIVEPPPPPVNEALFTYGCEDKSQRVCTFRDTDGSDGSWLFSDNVLLFGATVTRTFTANSTTRVTHTVGSSTSAATVRCNKKNCR